MIDIRNTDDTIDVRDAIAVIEAYDNGDDQGTTSLRKLLTDLRHLGTHVCWRGAWYPLLLVRDSHFKDYIQGLLKGIVIPEYLSIDWDATSRNMRVDYLSVEFEGVIYWFR